MSWSEVANIKGPQGDTGADGSSGQNVSVWTGTAAQYSGVDKNAYDLYLVTQ